MNSRVPRFNLSQLMLLFFSCVVSVSEVRPWMYTAGGEADLLNDSYKYARVFISSETVDAVLANALSESASEQAAELQKKAHELWAKHAGTRTLTERAAALIATEAELLASYQKTGAYSLAYVCDHVSVPVVPELSITDAQILPVLASAVVAQAREAQEGVSLSKEDLVATVMAFDTDTTSFCKRYMPTTLSEAEQALYQLLVSFRLGRVAAYKALYESGYSDKEIDNAVTS